MIAIGILAGSGQFKSELLSQYAIVGELALDGTARPVKGALSMAMAAAHVGEFLRNLHSRLGETRPRVRGIIVHSANAVVARRVI